MDGVKLLQEAGEILDTIIKDRRYLHEHPGVGFEIEETISYVKAKLLEIGCSVQDCGKAGLVACIGGKQPGKTFLLRADMDGLPMQEAAELDFSATNGRMHACGHDMHTAMLLGAARLFKGHEAEIPGTVKLMFQPAEEIFEGAKDMIEAGVLKEPAVDAAMMYHVMAGLPFPAGLVMVSAPGVGAAAADYFEIRVQGKGCHGSAPNAGIDPLTAAAHILIALQELPARELALDQKAVLTLGTMHAGTAANVIPDTVTMGGTLRTFDEGVRSFLKERIVAVATHMARTFRSEATVEFGSGCPTLYNDETLVKEVLTYHRELLGEGWALSMEDLQRGSKGAASMGGSEDFAYVSREVPAVMVALAAGDATEGYRYSQHHPKVTFDESALKIGCAGFVYTALRWLEEHKE